MQKSYLVLDKYWVTHSVYFRLTNTVELGMVITYGKPLFCHGISEQRRDKKISVKDYKDRKSCDSLNNPFPVDFGSPDLNTRPVSNDDISSPNKRACYTPAPLPAAISAASVKSVSTFTTPSDSPQVILLTSDSINTDNSTSRDKPGNAMEKIGYCSRRHDG